MGLRTGIGRDSKYESFENHPVPPYPEGGFHRSPQAPLPSWERGCKPLLSSLGHQGRRGYQSPRLGF